MATVPTRLMAAIFNVIRMVFQKLSLDRIRTQLLTPTHLEKFPCLSVKAKESTMVLTKG